MLESHERSEVKNAYLKNGKETASTKNTSCNQTTTEISMDTKPLSQRKSFAHEQDRTQPIEVVKKDFYSSNTKQSFSDIVTRPAKEYHKVSKHKPKISDLFNYKNGKLDHSITRVIGPDGSTNKIPPSTAPAPMRNHLGRVHGMMQDLVMKETMMRRASHKEIRGRSESNNRASVISNVTSQTRGCSYDKKKTVKDYKLGRQIGKGAYAVVRMVIDKVSKQQQAMKIYEKYKLTDPARRKSVTREISIMKRIQHPNIVKMITSFDNPHSIYIVMEHVKGRSLYQYLKERPGKRLNEDDAKNVILQIAQSLQYVHSQNVAHRDLKLENLIINSNTKKVTLIDFGFSITSGHEKKLKIF